MSFCKRLSDFSVKYVTHITQVIFAALRKLVVCFLHTYLLSAKSLNFFSVFKAHTIMQNSSPTFLKLNLTLTQD